MLVLSMLISVPLFDSGTYIDDNISYPTQLMMMSTQEYPSDGFNILFKSMIEQ